MSTRWPLVIALVGFTAWLFVAIATWATAMPLGHDESQYALAARDALAGQPPRWFYLSPGMNAVAIPGVWLGGGERALRFLPMLLGVGFLAAAYVFARRVVGATSAAWAIVVLAASRNIVRMSSELLSDMPAAACLLLACALIAGEIERTDGARWRIVIVGPVLAAAFYLRYGSVIPIAVIVGASVIAGARTLVRRPLPVLVTAAAFLVCLVPHFLDATQMTDSALGILRFSRIVPNEVNPESGLVTYLTSNPIQLYGSITTVVLLAGVVAGVGALRLRDRRRVFAWLAGIGTFVAMGLTAHGVLRYILVPVAIMIVLGADQISRWVELLSARPRRIAVGACVAALAVLWFTIARRQLSADDYRALHLRGTLTGAEAVRRDAAGAQCLVIGYRYTQLEWYSGCMAPLIMDPDAVQWGHERGRRVYVVREFARGPAGKWDPGFAAMPGSPRLVFASFDVEVRRF